MSEINNGNSLGWEDEIEQDSQFVELPEGDYDFSVDHYERAEFNGSDKIPPCHQANVFLNILLPDGNTVQVRDTLILHTKMEWKLSSFFASIGLKKKGERVQMKWNQIAGRKGRCKISLDPDKSNPDRKYNHVRTYYPAADNAPAQSNWSWN